jgi:hypothetical protein
MQKANLNGRDVYYLFACQCNNFLLSVVERGRDRELREKKDTSMQLGWTNKSKQLRAFVCSFVPYISLKCKSYFWVALINASPFLSFLAYYTTSLLNWRDKNIKKLDKQEYTNHIVIYILLRLILMLGLDMHMYVKI